MHRLVVAAALCVAPSLAGAQTPAPPVVPPSLLLPNYNRVLVGEQEALEGGAFTARAEGAVAAFYNPAGLGLAKASAITAGFSTQEWMRYSVTGVAASTSRTTNRTIGGVFGIVLGPDEAHLEQWRFAFLVARPVSFQPELEMRAHQPAAGGSLGSTYITTSRLSDFAPAIAAAYILSPTLRVGGSVRLSSFSLYQNQALYFDLVGPSSVQTAESTLFSQGGVWSLVASGGIQWDVRPRLRVGAHVVLPSMRLVGGSSIIVRASNVAPQGGTLVTFDDPDAAFDYRQPFAVSAGAAYTFERGAIEFDVKHYAGIGPYEMFTTSRLMEQTTVTAAGALTTTLLPFPSLVYQPKAVTNVAVGGRYRFNDAFTAHGGYYTDQSPVESGPAAIFARMSLSGVTAGAAVQIRRLIGSGGVAYLTGESAIDVPTPAGVLVPQIRVRSIQMFYAITVTF